MTRSTGIAFMISIFCLCIVPSAIRAQGFGGFGGAGNAPERAGLAEGAWDSAREVPLLPPENALNFITIDGTADLRVVPEGIRVVLAITSEAETADGCQEKNAAQVQAVLKAWADLKIAEENIVEDFINVLPVYEWRLTERDGQKFRVQQREGYRMQTNLHVSVKTETDAMAAIQLAFQQDVTDIVTFDYWSSELDEQKAKARVAALEAAKEKSKILLAVFADPPKVINIQESTAVFLPHSLYRTYENVLEEQIQYNSSWQNLPAIKAYRPKMTYFQGLQSRSDLRPAKPAMRPEIAVVSTVRLYYQSPADKTVAGKSH
ncbi:MAG: SIMPL domain-containing protein [Pirellulales bacterium]